MVPLVLKQVLDPRYPDFAILRNMAEVFFEPAQPGIAEGFTLFAKAIIDSGAGYTIIPYRVHKSGLLKIYQELDPKPYQILSEGEPNFQRFAEVGFQFFVKQPNGQPGYWPAEFVRIKAYLLDEATRPTGVAVLGLDTLLEHFITHLEKNNSFLKGRDGA
jgi:hypothetical protein